MFEDSEELIEAVEQNGELMVVLDSDREYALHTHDTDSVTEELIRTEGLKDGEYLVVQFPVSAIEHTYVHRES